MERLNTLVRVNVGASSECHILHHCQSVKWNELKVFGNGLIIAPIVLRTLWDSVSRDCSLVTSLSSPHNVDARLL